MIRKLVVMTFILAICVSTQSFLAAQTGQSGNAGQASSPSADKKMAGGHKSVVGCVVKQDGEFYLKTDEGTYQFNTDRDLTPYVGKKSKNRRHMAGYWCHHYCSHQEHWRRRYRSSRERFKRAHLVCRRSSSSHHGRCARRLRSAKVATARD